MEKKELRGIINFMKKKYQYELWVKIFNESEFSFESRQTIEGESPDVALQNAKEKSGRWWYYNQVRNFTQVETYA